jgi:hypothetical protein
VAGRTVRSWAEELLAVAAAEQEDEALQVVGQLGQAVGGVADELGQGDSKAPLYPCSWLSTSEDP